MTNPAYGAHSAAPAPQLDPAVFGQNTDGSIPANREQRRAQKAADFRAQAIEALGQIAEVVVIGNSGKEYQIPNPLAMSDEQQTRFAAVQRGDDLDKWPDDAPDIDGVPVAGRPNVNDPKINGVPVLEAVRVARAILGPELHAEYIADGGTSNDVSLAFKYMTDGLNKEEGTGPKLPS